MPAALDPLTWLPNRELFCNRLAQALRGARKQHPGLALLHIDLDRFRDVDELFGRSMAERVLREAAARLSRALHPGGALARLGEDDFAALVPAADLAGAARVAGVLLERCRQPYIIECISVVVTASIGIALYPAHAADAARLMERAERALYGAKLEGRDRYHPRPGPAHAADATCCGDTARPPRTARA